MDMLIAIPSRGRTNLSQSTLRHIPKEMLKQTILFVHASEEAKYKRSIFNCMFEDVQLVSFIYDRIAEKRELMAKWASRHGWQKFCMIDDDISQFSVRIKPGETSLRKSTINDNREMFETVSQYLDWYAHVGISQRFHNNAYSGEDPIIVENTRMLRFLAYQTDKYLSCDLDLVLFAQDMHVTIQLLQKGYKNAVLFKWAQDQAGTNTPGGCALYRTVENHRESIQELHRLYPGITRLREKENKSKGSVQGGFEKRTEIVVDWKGAYRAREESGTGGLDSPPDT